MTPYSSLPKDLFYLIRPDAPMINPGRKEMARSA
jgi:hypothetical protein